MRKSLFLIVGMALLFLQCWETPTDKGSQMSDILSISIIQGILQGDSLAAFKVIGMGFTTNTQAFLDGETLDVSVDNDTELTAYCGSQPTESKHGFLLKKGTLSASDTVSVYTGINGIVWKGAQSSPPANPITNWAYLNTQDNATYLWDGTRWVTLIIAVVIETGRSITWKGSYPGAPSAPDTNWAYYNSTENVSYIWNGGSWDTLAAGTTSADSVASVSIAWKGSSAAPPANPRLNWAYYNTADNTSYIYDGDSWEILVTVKPDILSGEIAIAAPSLTNDPTPTFTWTSYPGALGYRYRFINQAEWTAVDTSTLSFTPLSPLSDGEYIFVIQALIGASTYTKPYLDTTVIDCTAPSKPVVASPSSTNNTKPEWTWNIPATTTGFRCQLDSETGSWTVVDATAVSFSPLSSLSTGSHVLYVQARDAIGNWSVSGSSSTDIDISAPLAPVVAVADSSGNLRPAWTWNLPAATVGFRYQLDGAGPSWTEVTYGTTSYTPSIDLSEGLHTLYVQARDLAGNWSGAGSGATRLQLIPSVASPATTRDSFPTWTWTVPSSAIKLRYHLDSVSNPWVEVDRAINTYTPNHPLASGLHTLYVQAQNEFGTWSKSGSSTTRIGSAFPFPPVNQTDGVLRAYKLNPSQAAQFSATDGMVSGFWTIMASGNYDYIAMSSDNSWYAWNRCATSPFAGGDDVKMVIRAAYTDQAIYLLIDIWDDNWVDYMGWPTDVVDIYLDAMDATGIQDPMNWFNPTQWALTFSSKEIQVGTGGTSPIIGYNYRYYDDLAMSITDHAAAFGEATFESMTMEITTSAPDHKQQEWMIPITQVSPVNGTTEGRTIGFTAGYNDVDNDAPDCPNSLRWQGLCDPYCEPPNPAVWGGLEFGPSLGQ